jgi:hypothetical protein
MGRGETISGDPAVAKRSGEMFSGESDVEMGAKLTVLVSAGWDLGTGYNLSIEPPSPVAPRGISSSFSEPSGLAVLSFSAMVAGASNPEELAVAAKAASVAR